MKLVDAFSALEEQKDSFVMELSGFSREMRVKRPANGWNMLQVIEHIITSEAGTLEYMKRKTLAPAVEIPLAGEQSAQGSRQLNSALKSDKLWKAPEVLPDPTGTQSLENMLSYWDALRGQYRDFLEQLDPAYYHRAIFKHPISGRLDLFQTIEFLTNHIIHHRYQIHRISRETGG